MFGQLAGEGPVHTVIHVVQELWLVVWRRFTCGDQGQTRQRDERKENTTRKDPDLCKTETQHMPLKQENRNKHATDHVTDPDDPGPLRPWR